MNKYSSGDPGDYVRTHKKTSARVLDCIPEEAVAQLITLLQTAREEERQIFLCGNGGSAATALHLANDLGKGASAGSGKRFRVLALTGNISWITALANDMDFSQIFVEQLKNFGLAGDLLIVFSGSGSSPNVLEAVKWAKARGMITVGITGRPGGELVRQVHHAVSVESSEMAHIEEAHFIIQHMLTYYFMAQDS